MTALSFAPILQIKILLFVYSLINLVSVSWLIFYASFQACPSFLIKAAALYG